MNDARRYDGKVARSEIIQATSKITKGLILEEWSRWKSSSQTARV